MKIGFYFRKNIIAKGDFIHANRVCQYINENYPNQHELICVNYSDMDAKELMADDCAVRFFDVQDDNVKELEDAILIVPFNQLLFVIDEFKNVKNVKICTTFMHPSTTGWFSNQLVGGEKDCRKLLGLVEKTSAYALMDESNRLTIGSFAGIHQDFMETAVFTDRDKRLILQLLQCHLLSAKRTVL